MTPQQRYEARMWTEALVGMLCLVPLSLAFPVVFWLLG